MKTLSAEGFSFVDLAEFFALEWENVSHIGPHLRHNRPIMAEQRPVFNILPVGWDHAAWRGGFYPEDLPPEWRLSYFANAFPGVLIPWEDWYRLDKPSLNAWRDDVAGGFRFYLELAQSVDMQTRVDAADCLEGHFGGFVVVSTREGQLADYADSQSPELNYCRLFTPGSTTDDVQQGLADKKQVAWLIPSSDLPTLKGQRIFLEQLAAQVAVEAEVLLFLEGHPPDLGKLGELRTLAQLLGFA
jgi:hypothetical protein